MTVTVISHTDRDTRILEVLDEIEALTGEVRQLADEIATLELERKVKRARILNLMDEIGTDFVTSAAGSARRKAIPATIELAISDLEFCLNYPEFCKPDPTKIRPAIADPDTDLAEVAILQPSPGYIAEVRSPKPKTK